MSYSCCVDFLLFFIYTTQTMSMLGYNEITQGKCIVLDGEPYEVIGSHVFRKQQRKPVNQTKLKNLVTDKVVEHAFHQSEKADEADLDKKEVIYLYNNRGEWWFCEKNDRSKRFSVAESLVGAQGKFLKENTPIQALLFDENIIGFKLPIKVELKVKEAAPAVRGNTVQGGVKQVVLETGAMVNVPMFVNEGDTLRINTETGEYTERVQ